MHSFSDNKTDETINLLEVSFGPVSEAGGTDVLAAGPRSARAIAVKRSAGWGLDGSEIAPDHVKKCHREKCGIILHNMHTVAS